MTRDTLIPICACNLTADGKFFKADRGTLP
jgi:hypothetical protein